MISGRRIGVWMCLAALCITMQGAQDSISIGTLPNGTEVVVRKHFFGKRIERFDPVPHKAQLCVKFIETIPPLTQDLGLYDVLHERMLWLTEMDFADDTYLCTSQGIIVQSGKATMLVGDDGNARWETEKFMPIYADERSGIVMGYPKAKSKKLRAISLLDGTEKWTQTLPYGFGWGEVKPTDEGRLLIVARQLCLLDPSNGEMKTLAINNSVNYDKTSLVAALAGSLAGMAMSFVTGYGTVLVPGPSSTKTRELQNSNLLADGEYIYFADRRNIWKLNRDLDIVWQQRLPKHASMSRLTAQGDTLFYENLGLAMTSPSQVVPESKPYRAAFSKQTGETLPMSHESTTAADEDEEDILLTCFVLDEEEKNFTRMELKPEELEERDEARLYFIDKPLPYGLFAIRNGNQYWIVDENGTTYLKLTEQLLQTEVYGNVLVGLTLNNVIFQFDLTLLRN